MDLSIPEKKIWKSKVLLSVAPVKNSLFSIKAGSTPLTFWRKVELHVILALDSPLEELAAEMKTFKLDINEELNRIFNQSSTLQTKPVASIKN